MSDERLNTGLVVLLIAVALAMFVIGPLWPKKALFSRPVLSASASASAAPSARRRKWHEEPRKRWALSPMTYCPGPNCTVEKKARADCEKRRGIFSAEPDFVCRLDDGVYRMVCDDIDDERQCGMMSHSDLAHARYELDDFWDRYRHTLVDIDFHADFMESKFRCEETYNGRELTCTFTQRSTGYEHPDSPIVCNWMGCGFPFAASAE